MPKSYPLRTGVILRVEELHSRTLPAVLDPAAIAVVTDDALVQTVDEETVESDMLFRCGTTADTQDEKGTPTEEVMTLVDGDEITGELSVIEEDIVFWALEDSSIDTPPLTEDEFVTCEFVATEYDPAVCYPADVPNDVTTNSVDVPIDQIDPAVCYMADVPLVATEHGVADRDAKLEAEVGQVTHFAAPAKLNANSVTHESDDEVQKDDAVANPPVIAAYLPEKSDFTQPAIATMILSDNESDTWLGIDVDDIDLSL